MGEGAAAGGAAAGGAARAGNRTLLIYKFVWEDDKGCGGEQGAPGIGGHRTDHCSTEQSLPPTERSAASLCRKRTRVTWLLCPLYL